MVHETSFLFGALMGTTLVVLIWWRDRTNKDSDWSDEDE